MQNYLKTIMRNEFNKDMLMILGKLAGNDLEAHKGKSSKNKKINLRILNYKGPRYLCKTILQIFNNIFINNFKRTFYLSFSFHF